jgi:uncharacterized protein with PQ loop repeat
VNLLAASQLLGFAGVALGLGGYMPQVVHLIRERCSAGISVQAYLIWLSGAALDLTVLLFATKYRGMICARHRLLRTAVGC